jgi:hypothetical protein
MGAGWEYLRQNRDVQSRFGELKRATHPGPTGANHHHIELATLQPISELG